MITVVILGLAVLYRYAPSRREPRWRWLSPGGVFAALAWIAGSALLSWYLESFANYDATYGSLGAAIGLMIWLWMSSIVVLLGAQLNSEIERQIIKDPTIGRETPLGEALPRGRMG
jgi:membrane protein